MWGSFKSFFIQESAEVTDANDLRESDEVEGWVLVDIEGNVIEKDVNSSATNHTKSDTLLSPLPLLDISNTSSPQISPQLSPTKIEEGWFVAPPPCFVINCPSQLEVSPLENLLIEHPSMSVYGRLPGCFKDKPEEMPQKKKVETGAAIISSEKKKHERTKKSGWAVTKVTSNPNNVQKQQQSTDLKNFIDFTENTKPVHHNKWEKEQYKLCPSYMNRQNRVHRYQSRKRHNQKKKSLAKPFAEKGSKHSS